MKKRCMQILDQSRYRLSDLFIDSDLKDARAPGNSGTRSQSLPLLPSGSDGVGPALIAGPESTTHL